MTEQSQNICKKVPLELLLHRLQLGFDESFIKYRLYGVQYILCTVLKWIRICIQGTPYAFIADLNFKYKQCWGVTSYM